MPAINRLYEEEEEEVSRWMSKKRKVDDEGGSRVIPENNEGNVSHYGFNKPFVQFIRVMFCCVV